MGKSFKTLVGVDFEGTFGSAVNLCKRLRFQNQEWILANVIPSIPWYGPGFSPLMLPIEDTVNCLNKDSDNLLARARGEFAGEEVGAISLEGDTAAALIRLADDRDVDLIVLGSGEPKHDLMWLIGSVSRALSIGAHRSLLVTKKPVERSGLVHVVFATDHSDYANRAAEQLIQWAPKGIRRIDVVSSYEVNSATIAMLKRDTTVDLEFEEWVRDHVQKLSEDLATRFQAIARETHVVVEKGDANGVIRRSMITSGADLLIVGANGHGFVDRLVIGSVSHHQMVAEPYPVLLIRFPNPA